jgi:hypothetical protein
MNVEKRLFLPKIKLKKPLEKHDFFKFLHVFQHFFSDISAGFRPILMKNTVLETPLVVKNMTEIRI